MSLHPDEWPLVRALFERAVELPAELRDRFLADACNGDEGLRQRVRALLDANQQAGAFLEGPPPAPPGLLPGGVDLSGAQLGPYRLEARIGLGGMGEVYRAHDARLQRTVAVKVLSRCGDGEGPEARGRFDVEARAVAALSHPNICTLYDVGVEVVPGGARRIHYLVMEFLHGQTLSERLADGTLAVPDALEHTIQICQALECAHAAGIVHRDLTPGNIMLTASGAKLLDFGLARHVVSEGPVQAARSGLPPASTRTAIAGTLHYMAPEQLDGRATDPRADLFALGCVLYEMVTRQKACGERSHAHLLSAARFSEPGPVSTRLALLPDDLARIITKCLAREPDDRWQSPRDLRMALERTAASLRPSPPRHALAPRLRFVALLAIGALLLGSSLWTGVLRSRNGGIEPSGSVTKLAVLPLRMIGGADGDDHLGVGIADSIITRLAAVRQIGIRPTAAVLHLADDTSAPSRVAALLEVDAVLVGTIQRSASAYRVSVQLVRGRDGAVTWARTYHLIPGSLLSIQDTLAEEMVDALRLELTPAERERLRRRHTKHAQAYDLYVRGRASLLQYSEEAMTTAVDAFERAVALDPQFHLARAGLATACAWFSIRYAYETDALRWGERAQRHARAAVAADASLAEAVLATASAAGTLYGGFDWPVVIEGATHALSLDPTLDLAHVVRMRAFFHMGLFERMADEAAAARELNPLGSIEIARLEIAASLHEGAYERARDEATALLARSDAPAIRNYLGLAQFYSGDTRAARATLGAVMRRTRPDVRAQAALAAVEAASGERLAARTRALAIEQGPYMDHHVAASLGGAWAQLGDVSASVKWLQVAADSGFPCYPWMVRDPMLDPIRQSPEFVGWLERLRRRHERDAARFGPAM
jgi:eukaryotic-like serine/threonine-protein kinase